MRKRLVALISLGGALLAWLVFDPSPAEEEHLPAVAKRQEARFPASWGGIVHTAQTDAQPLPARRIQLAAHGRNWKFPPTPEPAPGVGVAALYARLVSLPSVTPGEAVQMTRLLGRCRVWAGLHRRAQEQKAQSEPPATSPQEVLVRDADLCKEIPEQAGAQTDRWLQQAAQAGDPEAQYLYGSGQLHFLTDPLNLLREPERVIDFKRQALAYLETLAEQGHDASLVALSDVYERGTLAPADAAKATAYLVASMRGRGMQHELIERHFARLSSEDATRARAMADEIFQRCCALTRSQ